MPRRSLIVPLSRFKASNTREAVSPGFFLRKKTPKKNHVESTCTNTDWFIKSLSETDDRIASAMEAYSAWCYHLFINNGYTQPKHYLIKDGDQYSVASKRIIGFNKINQAYKEFPPQNKEEKEIDRARRFIDTIFINNKKNCQLFAEMLVEFIRQGGNNFNLEHLGLDRNGHLVKINFEQANVALTYDIEKLNEDRVQRGKSSLNFAITAEDLEKAPVFRHYKPADDFVRQFSRTLAEGNSEEVFAGVSASSDFRRRFHRALLKRIIFPVYLEFAALELIGDEEDIREFTHQQCRRDIMLREAALAYPDFVTYLRSINAETDKETIIADLSSAVPHLRPFRHLRTDTIEQELRSKVTQKYKLLSFDVTNKDNQDYNPALSNALIMLMDFLENEVCRLEREKTSSSFIKGLDDKRTLYQELQKAIKNFNQDSFPSDVMEWFKKASLIAHHRRYSKCNTIFFHTTSNSWSAFKKLIHEVSKFDKAFSSLVNSKGDRAITMQQDQVVDSYNQYRQLSIGTHT